MRLSRKEIFHRDRYTCQYCGKQTHDLTLDHVVPRHLGGSHDWENLVSACRVCNHRKAGKMPQQARMTLVRQPSRPHITSFYLFYHYLEYQIGWRKFIPGWERADGFS
jgi:5-methylcytosine-specific restriction endonuclease McrA